MIGTRNDIGIEWDWMPIGKSDHVCFVCEIKSSSCFFGPVRGNFGVLSTVNILIKLGLSLFIGKKNDSNITFGRFGRSGWGGGKNWLWC